MFKPARRVGTQDDVTGDPRTEGVLVGMQNEVTHRYVVLPQTTTDLSPILLDRSTAAATN